MFLCKVLLIPDIICRIIKYKLFSSKSLNRHVHFFFIWRKLLPRLHSEVWAEWNLPTLSDYSGSFPNSCGTFNIVSHEKMPLALLFPSSYAGSFPVLEPSLGTSKQAPGASKPSYSQKLRTRRTLSSRTCELVNDFLKAVIKM